MSTPTINLPRAGRPSQSRAQRDNDEPVWRPVDQGGPREEGDWGPDSMQSSNLSRFRVLRGLVWLDDIVPLPQTLRGYLFFVLALTVVCSLAVVQVWTSLRITQARAELEALQKNAELLWQIGQRTTLEHVQLRAVQLDFRPALQRNYVPNPHSLGATPALSDATTGSDSDQQLDQQSAESPALDQSSAEAGEQSAVYAAAAGSLGAAQERQAPSTTPPVNVQTGLPSADGPSFSSVTERLPVKEFEQYLSGWQQQINESWQSVRDWSEPLLEQAGDFFLGQLKQPR